MTDFKKRTTAVYCQPGKTVNVVFIFQSKFNLGKTVNVLNSRPSVSRTVVRNTLRLNEVCFSNRTCLFSFFM